LHVSSVLSLYRIDNYLAEKKTNLKVPAPSTALLSGYALGITKFRKKNQGTPNALQQQDFGNTPGVVVLGMGRSGTSLLTGLCTKALQYKAPGRLKPAQKKANAKGYKANAKGYFENVNVINQNEVWLREQGTNMYRPNLKTSPNDSSTIISGFSWQESCATDSCLETSEKLRNKADYFYNLDLVLQHYNNPTNKPWIMKDPRLCLTLKLWLQVLDGPPPAAIIVIRNPLDNALSHKARSDPGSLGKFFRLWIWFNRLAIENSRGLCRVVTRTEVLMQDPESEIQRIAKELAMCGLPIMTVETKRIHSFFSKELVHHAKENITATKIEENNALNQFSPRRVNIRWKTMGQNMMHNIAMKVYQDLESGEAFKEDYVWPILT